jgi:hypothetical protein
VEDAKLTKLTAELKAVEDEYWRVQGEQDGGWQAVIGPFRISQVLNSMSWFRMILTVSAASFIVGAALTFVDPAKELGIALVVGAIFAGVSFLGQAWTLQVQAERAKSDRLFGKDEVRELRDLLKSRQRILAEIETLGDG